MNIITEEKNIGEEIILSPDTEYREKTIELAIINS
jgi:hypothetical protein